MPRSEDNKNLHGNVPDRSRAALLLIYVINDLEFPGNAEVVKTAKALAKNMIRPKKKCAIAGSPSIYVADNRSRWRSDRASVVKAAMRPGVPGRDLTGSLKPRHRDYIVWKPLHSAFYATQTILEYLGVKILILVGLTTEFCVMLAAGEAFVLDYQLMSPAIASRD